MDAQDIQDLVSGVGCLVIPGIRRPAPDHRPSRLPVQQPLVLFILCILCIDVNCEGIFDLRRRAGAPHRISLRLPARLLRLPLQGGASPGSAGVPPASCSIGRLAHQHDVAGSHHVGGNHNGQAEGEPWRRCRSILVAEMAEAVPGIVRAGRPRSQEAFIHTINRKQGLHLAEESGKKPFAGLKNHSPLEGESARQGRSPASSRWGGREPARSPGR